MKTAKDIFAEIALRQMYGQYRQRLENYARLIVRDEEAAKDIVSNTIAAVLQSETPLEEQDIVPYLFRSVRNRALNYRRDSSRHEAVHEQIREREGKAFEHFSQLIESSDPADVFASEIYALVRKALAEMPEEQRQAWLLKRDGHTYKEIAATLGITEDRVDKDLRKALKKLHISLKDYIELVVFLVLIGGA